MTITVIPQKSLSSKVSSLLLHKLQWLHSIWFQIEGKADKDHDHHDLLVLPFGSRRYKPVGVEVWSIEKSLKQKFGKDVGCAALENISAMLNACSQFFPVFSLRSAMHLFSLIWSSSAIILKRLSEVFAITFKLYATSLFDLTCWLFLWGTTTIFCLFLDFHQYLEQLHLQSPECFLHLYRRHIPDYYH